MEDPMKNTRRVQRQPGDRYVVQTKEYLPAHIQARLREEVARQLGVNPTLVAILDGGLDLTVVGLEDQRRVPDLLEANNRLHNRNVNLSCAIIRAQGVFIEYAKLHEAKGTEDGAAKARANREHARYLDDFLTAFGPEPVPVVPVAEAGPVIAGGSALVGAFMHTEGMAAGGPEDAVDVKGLLEAFVDFARDQLKARMAGAGGGVVDMTKVRPMGERGPEVVMPLRTREFVRGLGGQLSDVTTLDTPQGGPDIIHD